MICCVSLPGNWLSAGSHEFGFRFNLPARLPSTFTSKFGHIFYFVQATCWGRESILGKKRVYLMVQGTSDLHRKNSLQVAWVRGKAGGEGDSGGVTSKVPLCFAGGSKGSRNGKVSGVRRHLPCKGTNPRPPHRVS